ncbi:hypothetical protein TNCV_4731151 [Trichonephila clavipes]|nr:hypothetical protein TNCV_4731151 [Trichonephila clavipes]
MPLGCWGAKHYQLTIGDCDRIIELYKQGLPLRSTETPVQPNGSANQRCVRRRIQEGLSARGRGSDVHMCACLSAQIGVLASRPVLLKVSIVATQYSIIIFIAPPHTITMF